MDPASISMPLLITGVVSLELLVVVEVELGVRADEEVLFGEGDLPLVASLLDGGVALGGAEDGERLTTEEGREVFSLPAVEALLS